jgi:hypothetical protein
MMMTFGSPQCIIRLVPSDGPVLLFLSAPPDFEKRWTIAKKIPDKFPVSREF